MRPERYYPARQRDAPRVCPQLLDTPVRRLGPPLPRRLFFCRPGRWDVYDVDGAQRCQNHLGLRWLDVWGRLFRHGRRRRHFLDGLIGFVPLDDFESYSPPDHLRFEICSMKLPRRCLPNAKPSFSAKLPECFIICQRFADAFIHLDEAVIGEPLIIHRVSRHKSKLPENQLPRCAAVSVPSSETAR